MDNPIEKLPPFVELRQVGCWRNPRFVRLVTQGGSRQGGGSVEEGTAAGEPLFFQNWGLNSNLNLRAEKVATQPSFLSELRFEFKPQSASEGTVASCDADDAALRASKFKLDWPQERVT